MNSSPSLHEHFWKYEIIYADPPWPYYGSETKNAAAGKHYNLMELDAIQAMPVRSLLRYGEGCVFLWATCPRLHFAIDTLRKWGFHYRGVAFVWVKCRADGGWIHGQGIPPTATKPTTELCLLGTTQPKGRPYKLQDSAVRQAYDIEDTIEIAAPRGKHSQKPEVFRTMIERLYGERLRLELFARQTSPGWYSWGNEVC